MAEQYFLKSLKNENIFGDGIKQLNNVKKGIISVPKSNTYLLQNFYKL